jgi:hypothetical protein
MADYFRLAETRQADAAFAPRSAQPFVGNSHIWKIHADGSMSQFEDQRLFMVQTAVTGNGGDAGRKGFA